MVPLCFEARSVGTPQGEPQVLRRHVLGLLQEHPTVPTCQTAAYQESSYSIAVVTGRFSTFQHTTRLMRAWEVFELWMSGLRVERAGASV